jgi:hypothetical protein
MEIQRQRSTPVYLSSQLRLPLAIVSLIAGAAVSAALCSRGTYRDALVITALSLVSAIVFTGHLTIEKLLLTWFATTPLASFYLRFPLDRSIITYDRLVFFLVLMLMLSETRLIPGARSFPDRTIRETDVFSLTKFEIAWALLSLAHWQAHSCTRTISHTPFESRWTRSGYRSSPSFSRGDISVCETAEEF